MKTLLLMRHAKSSWAEAGMPDHDRPLNDRGRRDAPRMARRLADAGLLPDRLLCSTATRARQTAELLVPASGYAGPVSHDPRLYHATPDAILGVVAETPDDAARLLVIAHNPGLEQLVRRLAGDDGPMPTAAVAQIELPIARWRDAPAATGRLVELRKPKDE
jgi:phosphohistidine phosphatase